MSEENQNEANEATEKVGYEANSLTVDNQTSEESSERNTEATEEQLSFPREDLPALIQSLIFVHGSPLSFKKISNLTRFEDQDIKTAIEELRVSLLEQNSGIELVEVAEGYQLRTKVKFSPAIRNLKLVRPRRLSPAALETLAIVAYRQPVVKSDIEAIRGVDTSPTLKTLLDRRLIRIMGHQATPGQPALYGTTDDFLEVFGLSSLSELPTLRDLKELNQEPGESEDPELEEEDLDNQEQLEEVQNEAGGTASEIPS